MTCTFRSKLNFHGAAFKTILYFPQPDIELFKEAADRMLESCGTTMLQAGSHHVLQGDWNSSTWGATERVNGRWTL